MGTKARPFYRMVVAHSTKPRGGKFVEILGTYNPVAKPVLMNIKQDRALHWLLSGAQPTETAAVVLNKVGVLDEYFSQRPAAKKDFKFLDKRTAAISVKSVMETPTVEAPAKPAEPAPAPEPEPAAEAATEAVEAVAEEAPAAEAAPVADETPAPAEAPAEEASTPAEAAEENAE